MDLSTTYLGFKLATPIVPGASPMCDDLSIVKRLEDAGAPMIVMHSMFQEQLHMEQMAFNAHTEQAEHGSAEALGYLPEPEHFKLGPDEYLEQIARISRIVDIPVVASLNGRTLGGWIDYARQIQQAGADALELNIYDPVMDVDRSGALIEQETLAVVSAVRRAVQLPLAVKLSPQYTSLPHFSKQLADLGVNAIVLFNRFYQVDLDIEHLDVSRDLTLSTSAELLPRLRAIASLAGRVDCELALTGGVHTAVDVIKGTMAGANVVQMVSALLNYGPLYLRRLHDDLKYWLVSHEYTSLSQARGSLSLLKSPNPAAFERGNYMKILQAWETV